MAVIRDLNNFSASLDRIIRFTGPDLFICRAYEREGSSDYHGNRIMHNGYFYGDISLRENKTEKELKKDYQEAYRLIDQIFPELINLGLKNDGYVTYKLEEVEGSGLIK